jgi:YD repeat-containing protein
MRKFYHFIIIVTLFTSCQKEITPGSQNGSGNAPATSNKVKTYTEDVTSGGTHSIITYDLVYDGSNRLISLTSETSPGDKFLYQYSSNSFKLDVYSANAITIHEVGYLKSNSFLDSTFQYDNTQDTTTEKYMYNGSSQLVTLQEYNYSKITGAQLDNTTAYTYDNNGNMVSATDDFSVTNYTYTNLLNSLVLIPSFLPPNKYLVKTTTYTSGGSSSAINHAYTFDASNRLNTETDTDTQGDVLIKTYTYY